MFYGYFPDKKEWKHFKWSRKWSIIILYKLGKYLVKIQNIHLFDLYMQWKLILITGSNLYQKWHLTRTLILLKKVRLIEYSQFNSNVVWHNENTINISADTDKAVGLMPYI